MQKTTVVFLFCLLAATFLRAPGGSPEGGDFRPVTATMPVLTIIPGSPPRQNRRQVVPAGTPAPTAPQTPGAPARNRSRRQVFFAPRDSAGRELFPSD